jgi:hypothetical protein
MDNLPRQYLEFLSFVKPLNKKRHQKECKR